MSEFEHSTTIDASPDEVFAFMSQVENLPKSAFQNLMAELPKVVHGEALGNR